MIALLTLLALGGLSPIALILFVRRLEAQTWRTSLVAYRMGLPRGLSADDVAAWLGHLVAGTRASRWSLLPPPPLALEVNASAEGIEHVVLVPSRTAGAMLAAVRAAMPGVRLTEVPDYFGRRPRPKMAAEGRLTNLSRPLALDRAERATTAFLASLSPLRAGEKITLQWIMVGARTPAVATARDSSSDLLSGLLGKAVTSNAETVAAAHKKQADPLMQAVVRLSVTASDTARVYALFGQVWGTLRGLNAPGVQLVRRMLPEQLVAQRMVDLAVPLTAWPLTANVRELTGLLGLPLGEVALPGLSRPAARQLPPPAALPKSGTVMALSTYPGLEHRPLAIAPSDRLRHTWIIGPTGVGKSTLLCGQIVQDMEAGRSLAVIDPKGGDLIRDVLERVPDDRRDDVILIDPSSTDRPVGWNLLSATHGEHAEELTVDHLVHLMASLWRGSWGPRTSDVLRNALLTLTHARTAEGGRFTLVELPELLLNAAFRRFVTAQPTVPETVRPFWLSYEEMGDGERAQVIGPSLNKLRSFTTRTSLRLMLGQDQGIRLDEVFTKRRILLVSLPAGVIGTDTAALAGSLLMAGLWQATAARVTVPAAKRHPVMIYLDEFQSILRLPLDLADMLAQARGLGVGLVLAHQYLAQLPDEIRTAVLGTVRTQIAFQVEHDDAQVLAHRFAPLSAADLTNLAAYEIAMRPCVGGATLAPVTGSTVPLPEPTTDAATLSEAVRERFGTPRAEVEAALRARVQGPVSRQRTGRTRAGAS